MKEQSKCAVFTVVNKQCNDCSWGWVWGFSVSDLWGNCNMMTPQRLVLIPQVCCAKTIHQHCGKNCLCILCRAFFVFFPNLALPWILLRVEVEAPSHGFFKHCDISIHSLWLQLSEKAMPTHIHHKGLLLRSRGKLRQEVIMGTDSGGQCQASFRIHSLRSSCYIFYWRNKRWRAIFKREQFS